ncbi:hypothetical protein TRP8649_03350 [Pelagimonas phthalicica]|uniref:Uncharacterized protein n=1 Tax=Pelagimonas phthalicica TaxID=1037362 RepID=A0A238JGF1_9RHOB|nr:hypothetical protein [Pelagimonas phthalicica]TDS92157.1 hypothetical protein CLV87_3347 [Pelagimonas phthalicica]SMX29217.1 hypothetical protein TRP8649_03350 [Pelagimonas phthalicica]
MKNTVIAVGALTALMPVMAQADDLNLICSADIVICEKIVEAFEAGHDIDVNMVRLSSGEAYAKIRAEARNPRTDLWWAGSGDPHLQAANEELTQPFKSPRLSELHSWSVRQAGSANYRTVGV